MPTPAWCRCAAWSAPTTSVRSSIRRPAPTSSSAAPAGASAWLSTNKPSSTQPTAPLSTKTSPSSTSPSTPTSTRSTSPPSTSPTTNSTLWDPEASAKSASQEPPPPFPTPSTTPPANASATSPSPSTRSCRPDLRIPALPYMLPATSTGQYSGGQDEQ